MIKTKRVTYTLTEDVIRFVDWYSDFRELSKSKLVLLCLIDEGFILFEEEKDDVDVINHHSKKIKKTIPFTITLPIDIALKLDYYHKKMGIPKSHLVDVSITLLRKKVNLQIDEEINELNEVSLMKLG